MNKIRTFTFIFLLLLITLFSINISKNEKYHLDEKNSKVYRETIDFNEDIATQVSKIDDESIKEKNLKNENDNNDNNDNKNEKTAGKPLTFAWPCKGNVIIKFSPSEIIYDEILDQYRTSNGVVIKTLNTELNAICDGKITSIITNGSFEREITIKTVENHTIVIKGSFDNLIKHEGDIVLKGSKIGDIKLSNEYSYVYITIMKDNEYIDPVNIIS